MSQVHNLHDLCFVASAIWETPEICDLQQTLELLSIHIENRDDNGSYLTGYF